MTTFKIGDLAEMKKVHPCGSKQWVIYRVGADVGIRCVGCGRRVMLPRAKFEKQLKKIVNQESKERRN